jgi:ABC-type multidrug transport system fused ATPase/permease subunit
MGIPLLYTSSNFSRLFRHLPQRRRWQAMVVLGLMLVGALAEVLTLGAILPFLAVVADPRAAERVPLLGRAMQVAGLQPGPDLLWTLAGIFCAVAIAAACVRIVLAWATQKFVFRLGYDLGVAVYRRILFQPYSYHVARNSSEVLANITRVQQVVTGVLLPLMLGISSAVIALSIFTGLLLVNWRVALASGVGFGFIYLLVSVLTRSRLRANSRIISDAQRGRIQSVQEGVGGIRDVLIDHAQHIYLTKFAAVDTRLRDAQAANALIAASPRFVIEGMGMVMIVALALVLSRQPGGLMAQLPVLGALALGAQRMLPTLQLIYNGWTQIMGNHQALVDIVDLLEQPSAPELLLRGHAAPLPFAHALTLTDVSFRYGEDLPWVLRDVGMTIPKGARVGFVGKTGSGKSTALDLVMGLLQPTAGTIGIDGTPVTLANLGSWQEQIAHVPQHIYLSDASIRDNIAFGVPADRIDDARIHEAARKADILDFIEELPDGFNTMVGERGVRLSGGQRQRIGIARALYKRSSLLVFDEATSALDDATEASVMSSIYRLGRDLTVILIAHRLSTLRECDVIFRLEGGRLVEQGDYDHVLGQETP